jgi:hypothetical protein
MQIIKISDTEFIVKEDSGATSSFTVERITKKIKMFEQEIESSTKRFQSLITKLNTIVVEAKKAGIVFQE